MEWRPELQPKLVSPLISAMPCTIIVSHILWLARVVVINHVAKIGNTSNSNHWAGNQKSGEDKGQGETTCLREDYT